MSHSADAVPALEVSGLTVRRGERTAVRDAGFRVEQGRVCALLGMNGAGKSTVFDAVAGTAPAVGGRIRILGHSPEEARRRHLVGYMPQSDGVDWSFPVTVQDVVLMGRYAGMGMLRRPSWQDREAVREALELVGLQPLRDRLIAELSGGQRKRVFLARSLAQGAGLMLLDEPLAGVDRISAEAILAVLREAVSAGASVLVSVHEIGHLPRLADDVVLLNRRVVGQGSVEEMTRPEMLARAFGAAA